MFFSAATLLSALAIGASAKVYDIQVGGSNGELEFSPEAIFAAVGDQVVFHFHPKNHTVTQSSFADPCSKMDGGFNTGFMPVAANSTDAPPTQTYTVTDTSKPLWFYCAQGKGTPAFHCGKGMVFSINCPADPSPNSFTNFKKKALDIGAQLAASASASPASSSAAASATDGGYGGASSAAASASQTWSGYAAANTVYSAAYGSATVPPPASVATVTQTISLGSKVWTTTYGSYPGSPDPTPNAEPQVFNVKVGANAQLVFDPPSVQAKVNDIISFTFAGANHSVTQSSFADPCRRLKDASGTPMGFDSDFQFVGNGSAITVNMTVNDTAPAWFYCKQAAKASHCGAGMVFSVNSDEKGPRNFAAFQSLAKQLNGTASQSTSGNTTTSSSAGASPSPSNGAGITSASVTVVLGAVAFAVAALL